MSPEPQRHDWASRSQAILSENLKHLRPDCGLDRSILEAEISGPAEAEVVIEGDKVAIEGPDMEILRGFPRSLEESERRINFLKRQLSRVQNARLVFCIGIYWGLVPALAGEELKSSKWGVFIFLERSWERVNLAFRLYDLRHVLLSPDVYWCVGQDLATNLTALLRREGLFLIDRSALAAVIEPGLSSTQTETYQEAVTSAFNGVSADRREVLDFLSRAAVFPGKERLRIWTYVVAGSFHEPIVRAVVSGFEANGHHVDVGVLSMSRTAPFRFLKSLSKSRPDLVFLLNVPGGDFARALGLPPNNPFISSVPRVSWFADNAAFYCKITAGSFRENDWVFWMDRSFESALSSSPARLGGFLPVAASVNREGNDVEQIRHPVSFVGNVVDVKPALESLSTADKRQVLQQVDRLVCNAVESPLVCAREVVLRSRSLGVIEQVVRSLRRIPLGGSTAVAYFLYVLANAEKRVRFLRPLIPLGLHIYGGESWRAMLPEMPPDRIHSRVDIQRVPDVYRSSLVNISLHSAQCPTCLNARDFDVLYAGGCLVADWVPDAEAGLLVPDVHAIFARDPESLREAVEMLLADESRRHELGEAGREHVNLFHTYIVRTRELLRRIKE